MRRAPLRAITALLAGCGGSAAPSGADRAADRAPDGGTGREAGGSRDSAAVVVTPVPGDRPATGPARLRPVPAPGTVRVQEGPFTDRVRVFGLHLRGGKRPLVSGRMLNVRDVSDLLSLTIRADFYDRRGRRVAAGRRHFGEGEPFHDRPLRFRIRAKRPAPGASSAVLTIPDLVNE